MAKQIIDIGIQGNDGTGDSIRESFRKVNENFSEIYSLFGQEQGFGLKNLSDAPTLLGNGKAYGSNQLIMSNANADRLAARSLVEGDGIKITVTSDAVTLSSNVAGLVTETTPQLSHALLTNTLPIGGLPDLTTQEAQNEAVSIMNAVHGGFDNADSFAISKIYGDTNYLKVDPDTGGILGSMKVRDEPALPDLSNADYDSSLSGNYLKNEAVQRQHVVYRGGDTMTGPLKLNDHPYPLEGYGTPNGTSDLQAATKFYVDNSTFSSSINLYVSATSGDDLQRSSPTGKEGRYWQYSYKTVGAACLAAENLISLANQEPGPYRQKIAYTKNSGADQTFSTIQPPAAGTDVIYGARLIDGNINVYGYRGAFDRLQENRSFIQAETIAYINNKYVNKFTYDKAKCDRDVQFILDAVSYDLCLGTTFNTTRASTSYFQNSALKVTNNQLTQTIDAIKYTRTQLQNLSYNELNVQAYVGKIVEALCYDLIFQSNFKSIQVAQQFAAANTGLETDQMVEVITDLGNNIAALLLADESLSLPQSEIQRLILDNTAIIIDIVRFNTIPDVILSDVSTNSFEVSITHINGSTNVLTVSNESEFAITPGSSIRFSSPIGGGLSSAFDYYVLSASATEITVSQQINGTIENLNTYNSTIVATVTTGTTTSQISAKTLTLENMAFVKAEVLSYLRSEYPLAVYSKATWEQYIQNIVESVVYDMMYAGNSESIAQGLSFWDNATSIISENNLPVIKSAIDRISLLVSKIVSNENIIDVYQQSISQYTNETLIFGVGSEFVMSENFGLIKLIIENNEEVPAQITYPDETYVSVVLQSVRSAIVLNNGLGIHGFEVQASDYVDANFTPIVDTETLNQLYTLFEIPVQLLSLGINHRIAPTFDNVRGLNVGYVHAQQLLMNNLDFIAEQTVAYINANIDGGASEYVGFTFSTSAEEQFKQDVKYLVEAICYDMYYGGNSASVYCGQTFRIPDDNVYITIDVISSKVHQDLINKIIVNDEVTVYPGSTYTQFIDNDLTNGNLASAAFSESISIINNQIDNTPPEGGTVYPDLDSMGSIDQNFIDARTIIVNSKTAVANNTIIYLDETYQGGFNYNESLCNRDVGLIIDALCIDIITGGNYQVVNSGKSYYRNASARAIAIGSQYRETLDGINFIKDIVSRLLSGLITGVNDTTYQSLVDPVINPHTISAESIADAAQLMSYITDIIEGGYGAAPGETFGSGVWEMLLDNGYGFLDQGAPNNIDIIPAKILSGVSSSAYGSIISYTPGKPIEYDTIHYRLTKPGFFVLGEELEFGETVKDINIVIFLEAGIYYEDYPIRLPANCSIKGDEFRRTIIRPRDRISQSPWRKIFFYRDSIIDSMELGLLDLNNNNATASKITLSGTTNIITISLSTSAGKAVQVPSSWIGKILIGNYYQSTTATATSADGLITVSNISIMEKNKEIVFSGTTFGGIVSGATYYVTEVSASENQIKVSTSLGGSAATLSAATGSMSASIYKKGKAIIDSVSNNVMNCSVIYPFNVDGTVYDNTDGEVAFTWSLYDPINYGRHYLTNPLDLTSAAKNNKQIDVFLCNDSNRICNTTFQGHGGFTMVLDPEGQIKTKSPYGQVNSSFSQSINHKTFAGGQFVDGFAGRLYGTITAIDYNAISNFYVNTAEFNQGTDYVPTAGSHTFTNIPVEYFSTPGNGTDATVDITVTNGSVSNIVVNQGGTGYAVNETITVDPADLLINRTLTSTTTGTNEIGLLEVGTTNPTTNLHAGNKIQFSDDIGGLTGSTVYYIKTVNSENNSITVSETLNGLVVALSSESTTSITAIIYNDAASGFNTQIRNISGNGIDITVQGTTSATGSYVSGGTNTTIIVENVSGTILSGMKLTGVGYTGSQFVNTVTNNNNGTYTIELDAGATLTPSGTIVFGQSSGLDLRAPMPPCAFFVQGNRYQINDVKYYDPNTATVVLTLDINTPYNARNQYNNAVCQRDVGHILRAASYDMVIGSNFQSIRSGLSYLRSSATAVIVNQQVQTVAGINKARDLALETVSSQPAKDAFSDSVAIVNSIITQGANAAPAYSFPDTPYSLANTDSAKVRDILIANRSFIQSEITAWIAANASSYVIGGIKNIPNYNTLTCQRDVGYIVDALCYDVMYGSTSNSMTCDAAVSYYVYASSVISGEETITQAAYGHMKDVILNLVTNTSFSKSVGNTYSVQTTLDGDPLSYISNPSTKYTQVTNLMNLVIDYVYDGTFSSGTFTATIASGSTSSNIITVTGASDTVLVDQIIKGTGFVDNQKVVAVSGSGTLTIELSSPPTVTPTGTVTFFKRIGPDLTGISSTLTDARTNILDANLTAASPTIGTQVISFLNQGGLLQINIEGGGNKSMLANDFAMINDLGYGIVCTNGGISEQVSTFTYYCQVHYWANNGGQIRSVSGSNAHGMYGMRASGFDVTEKPDSVTLAKNMCQLARIYKSGALLHEMEPTASKQSLAIYIYNYEYAPYNTSEIEIDHTVEGFGIVRYEINSIEHTPYTVNNENILKLNLSTAGNNGTASSGLACALHHDQQVSIRVLQNVKFNNIDNVRPTRPSTALQYNDNLASIYRILAYNLADSTGELLPNNVAILQSDTSFAYYKFTSDTRYVKYPDLTTSIPIYDLTRTVSTNVEVTITLAYDHGFTAGSTTVFIGGIIPAAYNGMYTVETTPSSNEFTYIINTTNDPGDYVGFGDVNTSSQGYTVGDTSIAVIQVTDQAMIDQINRDNGTFIAAWGGRVHRVTGYVQQRSQATGTVVVSGTTTQVLKVNAVAGTISVGMKVTNTDPTLYPQGIGPDYAIIESIQTPDPADTNKVYTITLETALSQIPIGSLYFGTFQNSYITIDPNPVNNLSTDGTSIDSLVYNSHVTLEDFIDAAIDTGLSSIKTLVTYDVPWNRSKPIVVDGYYNITDSTNTAFTGNKHIIGTKSQTVITLESVSGLLQGMVVDASVGSPAVFAPDTTIQSVDAVNNTILVSPACWAPSGAVINATSYATVQSVVISNGIAGLGYSAEPIISFIGGGKGDNPGGIRVNPTRVATAKCTIDIATGKITTVTIIEPGYGYVGTPTVTVTPVEGTATPTQVAELTAIMSQTVEKTPSVKSGVSTNQITVAYDADPGTSFTTGTVINTTGFGTNSAYAEFDGSITGTTLTVSSVASGTICVGMIITNNDIEAGTYIASGSGLTWTVNQSQNVLSSTITGSKPGATFTGTISNGSGAAGTTLTVSSVTDGTITIGAVVKGTNVKEGTYITAGSGLSWTVSQSQYLASTTLTSSNVVVLNFGSTTAPTVGKWYKITGQNNPLLNGTYYATGSSSTSITLGYDYDPGTGLMSSFNLAGFSSKTASAPYYVTFSMASQTPAPSVGSVWVVAGNNNSNYNGTYSVIAATATSITLNYGSSDPGTYGTGATSVTNLTTITKSITSATSGSLGISTPFASDSAATLRLGYAASSPAQITVRISTCRATGHDFLDIGTGGYSTTNFPYQIYGNPAQSRDQSHEIVENGVGRVFYASTDQNGIFRVGRFFTVDQGTGTVTFSASIALSNLDGLGFKRGVVVSEFSTDSTMTNNAPEIVPVQSAVRGFVDRRLGLDYSGAPIPAANLIGPGFLPLNGTLGMTGGLNMQSFTIGNVGDAVSSLDATNKKYVDRQVDTTNAIAKLQDAGLSAVASGDMLVFNKLEELSITTAVISGSSMVFTFADSQISAQPFATNDIVTVTGVNINSYNGVWTVDTCVAGLSGYYTNFTVKAVNLTLAPASGGTATSGTWTNVAQPSGDVNLTYDSNTNLISTEIQEGVIVNSMIASDAAIPQSKLSLVAASTRANATGITQADRGLSSFDSGLFTTTNGWVTIPDSTGSSNGISLAKIRQITKGYVLGNLSTDDGIPGAVGQVSPSSIITSGDGLRNSLFDPTSPITSLTSTSRAMIAYRAPLATTNSYATIGITETGAINSLVKTAANGSVTIAENTLNMAAYALDVTGKLRVTRDIYSTGTITGSNFVLTKNTQAITQLKIAASTYQLDLTTSNIFFLNIAATTEIELTASVTPTLSTGSRVTLILKQAGNGYTTTFKNSANVVFMSGGAGGATAIPSVSNVQDSVDIFTFYVIYRPILDNFGIQTGQELTYVCADAPPLLSRKIVDFDARVGALRLDQLTKPTADVDFNSHKILNLAAPTTGSDATNKTYVDGKYTAGNGISLATGTNNVFSVKLKGDGTGGLGIDGTGALYVNGSVGTISGNSTWQGNAIGADYGGTGLSTFAAGDLLYAASANPTSLSKLTAPASESILSMSGSTPSWMTLPVPVNKGGTGASAGFTSGGLLKGNGTSAISVASASDIVAAIGTTAISNVVYTTGSYSDPSWLTLSKSKVGLGNVDNTADASKTVGTANALTTGNSYQVSSLGVGTAASGTAGEIRATNNVTAYYSSDRTLKTNIVNIENPLEKLSKINGVMFDWTDAFIAARGGEDGYFVRKHDTGVIAQEIQEILPQIVVVREDGTLAVQYEKIIPLLIESVKAQQAIIDDQEARIAKLEELVNQLLNK